MWTKWRRHFVKRKMWNAKKDSWFHLCPNRKERSGEVWVIYSFLMPCNCKYNCIYFSRGDLGWDIFMSEIFFLKETDVLLDRYPLYVTAFCFVLLLVWVIQPPRPPIFYEQKPCPGNVIICYLASSSSSSSSSSLFDFIIVRSCGSIRVGGIVSPTCL